MTGVDLKGWAKRLVRFKADAELAHAACMRKYHDGLAKLREACPHTDVEYFESGEAGSWNRCIICGADAPMRR